MNNQEASCSLANPSSTAMPAHPQSTNDLDSQALAMQASANTTQQMQTQATHTASPRPRLTGKEPAVSTLLDRLPAPVLASATVDSEQLSLPLVWEIAPGTSAVPEVPRHLRLVADTPTAPHSSNGPATVPGGPPIPPPIWVARMARAIAEVASGDRPAQQLTRWVAKRELAMLAARGKAARRHPSAVHGRNARSAMRSLQQVRAIRVCPVAPGVAETSAVLVGDGRGRAVAMRFEAIADSWQVTAIALG